MRTVLILLAVLFTTASANAYETCDKYCGLKFTTPSFEKSVIRQAHRHAKAIKRVVRTANEKMYATRAPTPTRCATRLGAATLKLVALINYKLAKWVHPTGKCLGSEEKLATYYWQGTRSPAGSGSTRMDILPPL